MKKRRTGEKQRKQRKYLSVSSFLSCSSSSQEICWHPDHLLLRLFLFLLAAQIAEIAFDHFTGGFGESLTFDGLGSFLGGLFDFALHFYRRLAAEVLSRRETVKNLLPFGIKGRACLAVERF